MLNQIEYNCLACEGLLVFDSASQKLKCPFCERIYDLKTFEPKENVHRQRIQHLKETYAVESTINWNVKPGGEWSEGETDNMSIFSCRTCGGEIVCDNTTALANCPYCGNPLVLKGKLSGMLKPDCIIPFKLDKKRQRRL